MLVAERRGIAERNFITHFWIGSTSHSVFPLKKNR